MPITTKQFEEFSRTKYYIEHRNTLIDNRVCIELKKRKTVDTGGSPSDINIVGKAMIYSGNNFSASSCIPCGSYCSDFS